MQLTYVFSELGTGLRRNVSMTVAVIVTIFVSLTLVGLGLLLNTQAEKAEEYWGDRLQITVFMCTPVNTPRQLHRRQGHRQRRRPPSSRSSRRTPRSRTYHFETSQQAYDKWREVSTAGRQRQQRGARRR